MWRWLAAAVLLGAGLSLLWMIRGHEPLDKRYTLALKLLRDGDFTKAAAEAERGVRGSDTPTWRSRFQLLYVEALLESGQAERAVAILDSMDASDSIEQKIRQRVLRARRLVGKGDLKSAQELLFEARRMVFETSRTDVQAEVELQLGQTFGRQRRLEEAEAAFETARNAALAAGDRYRQGSAVNNLGMIQMLRSHCDEAIPLFEQAEDLYRTAGANHWVVAARNNIGLCYTQLGDLENALIYRKAALELSRPSVLKANALGETGRVLLVDDPAKAVPLYRQARDMARQFGASTDAARWAGNLAFALAATRDWNAAEAALHEAKELGPEPRSRVFLDLNSASIALGRGRPDEARAIYEAALASSADNPAVLWEAHAGIASTYVAVGNLEEAGRSFEAATRVIEGARSDLNRNEHKLTFLARLIQFYRDYVDLLVSCNDTVRALAVADRSRARLLAERISRQVGRDAGLSAAEARSIAKASNSVWLAYWTAPKRSFLWAVTASDIRIFILPGQEEIASLVKEYRAFIETGMRDPMRTPNEAGRKLYQILIGPVAAMLPPGSRVMIIPDGPLHSLSFDTLPIYDSTPRYFIDDATVAITPSFGVFSGKRAAAVSGKDALIIGNPVSPSPSYPALKFAGKEIANVAAQMNSKKTLVLTGSAAQPEAWRTSNPGAFSTIHIAAHAEANEQSPLNSAIILSPGRGYRLYARDVIDVQLQADLVSLSACRSSGARTYAGEGMVGFAWAFLHAGARSVVAGLWDVPDESTAMLIDRLYAGVATAAPPVEALRQARLAVRKTAYSKPFYWGAFQCYMR